VRGLLGRRIPPEGMGGDWELGSRGIGNVDAAGELYEDGGADPDEYIDTVSSQSLVAPPEWTEDAVDDTEHLLTSPLYSLGSFLTKPPIFCFGLKEPTSPFVVEVCFLALFPARSSSNRKGRGRKCVRS